MENGLNLDDPVTIITPNKEILSKQLILRKSKLEYLKEAAIRASNANSIEELSEETELNKNDELKTSVTSVNDLSNIEKIVEEHFQFTQRTDNRKKKQMLSKKDYLKLVKWVTSFLTNNYKIPNIDTPIMELHIEKTKTRHAFKKLIHLYHPRKPKPDSFYDLIPKCFHALKDDTKDTIYKTPDLDKLDKQS